MELFSKPPVDSGDPFSPGLWPASAPAHFGFIEPPESREPTPSNQFLSVCLCTPVGSVSLEKPETEVFTESIGTFSHGWMGSPGL